MKALPTWKSFFHALWLLLLLGLSVVAGMNSLATKNGTEVSILKHSVSCYARSKIFSVATLKEKCEDNDKTEYRKRPKKQGRQLNFNNEAWNWDDSVSWVRSPAPQKNKTDMKSAVSISKWLQSTEGGGICSLSDGRSKMYWRKDWLPMTFITGHPSFKSREDPSLLHTSLGISSRDAFWHLCSLYAEHKLYTILAGDFLRSGQSY